jgi:hypothetical protein
MGLVELFRLLFSEDAKIVIPINDEEIEENYSCRIVMETDIDDDGDYCMIPNGGESENILRIIELIDKLSPTPDGKAPKFKLERHNI